MKGIFNGMTAKQVADELGISISQVRRLGKACGGDLGKVRAAAKLSKGRGPGRPTHKQKEERQRVLNTLNKSIAPGFYVFEMPVAGEHKPRYNTPDDSWKESYSWGEE